ncbi:Peptidase-M14 domain-containing protein [Aphelenchoides fujianensis]|nr:Peptidase-M14 domain-containing protein [Aphelenchoides fujianensis]
MPSVEHSPESSTSSSTKSCPLTRPTLESAARKHPQIAQLRTIGVSREGPAAAGAEDRQLEEGGHQAGRLDRRRESRARVAGLPPVRLLHRPPPLELRPDMNRITSYVDELNIYVFPVLNPDGFVFSKTSPKDSVRQWRKNRAPMNCSGYTNFKKIPTCCEGVDLNRNWDVAFSQSNYPFNNPCSDEYQGPFSVQVASIPEPETRAVRDFLLSPEINGRVAALVSLHTHGQFFILPYNYARKTYPDDYQDLKNMGPATGGMIDWTKQNTQIKYVYVVELPPPLTTFFAFQMKSHWLLPTAKETWSGMEVIIRQVVHEFA